MVSQDRIQDALWRMATVAIDDFLVSHEQIVAVAVSTSEDFCFLAVSLLSEHGLQAAVCKWASVVDIKFSPPDWDGYATRHVAEYAPDLADELHACNAAIGADTAAGAEDALRSISSSVTAASVEVLTQAREILEYRGGASNTTFYGLFFQDVTDTDCFRSSLTVSERVNQPQQHSEMLEYFRAVYSKRDSSASIRSVIDEFVNRRP